MTGVRAGRSPETRVSMPRLLTWVIARRVQRFRCLTAAEDVIKKIALTFITGFNDTLVRRDVEASLKHVRGIEEEFFKPFYVEGASLALAAVNALPFISTTSSPSDLLNQLPGYKHVIYAGWGWWYALNPYPDLTMRRADPSSDLFSALTLDGMAFARAFLFARPPYFDIAIPAASHEQQRLWVQGYGRALWFLAGADETVIERHRQRVGPQLAAELNAGLGLASGFAGMAIEHASSPITTHSVRPAYLQGFAFGLTARAMSTPSAFSNWLATLTPSQVRDAKRLVSRCLVEPRSISINPAITYTKWQDELRAEFQQTSSRLGAKHEF